GDFNFLAAPCGQLKVLDYKILFIGHLLSAPSLFFGPAAIPRRPEVAVDYQIRAERTMGYKEILMRAYPKDGCFIAMAAKQD
ncbi:hypothetical protein Q6316_29475, partial [Klebsiella pneumoniae]|nr:hypothetical protein [Klebsiella pneumoniae]